LLQIERCKLRRLHIWLWLVVVLAEGVLVVAGALVVC
jgi:hypothetical protein